MSHTRSYENPSTRGYRLYQKHLGVAVFALDSKAVTHIKRVGVCNEEPRELEPVGRLLRFTDSGHRVEVELP
jgi:hypothetical protein